MRPALWNPKFNGYVVALGTAAAALLLTLWLPALRLHSPLLLITAAVLISAVYAGVGPGLFASAIALLAAIVGLSAQMPLLTDPNWGDALLLILFTGLLVIINVVAFRLARAEDELLTTQTHLAQRVVFVENANKELKQALLERKRTEEDRVQSLVRQKTSPTAEEALRQKEESFALVESLLLAAGVGIVFLDQELRYVHVNEPFTRMCGQPPEDLLGRNLRQATPQLWSLLGSLLQKSLTDRLSIAYQEVSSDPSGPEGSRTWLTSCYPIKSSPGQRASLGLVMIDVTDRKHVQDLVAQHADELAKSHAKLERLAYMAFYELKEPLLMVTTHTKLLAKRYHGKLDRHADQLIMRTIHGISRMERLIAELVSYVQSDAQTKTIGPIEIKSILEWALQNLEHEMAANGAVVTHDPLPIVKGNATQLIHLFQSVIGQALKAQGALQPRLHLSAKLRQCIGDGDSEWIFSLQDNAMTVNRSGVDRIFLVYEGLQSATDQGDRTSNLAACKNIIEGAGGRIWIESQPRGGSILFFTLPSNQPESA